MKVFICIYDYIYISKDVYDLVYLNMRICLFVCMYIYMKKYPHDCI